MRLVVTRSEPGARRTASRLAALGHEPVLLPLFARRDLAPLPVPCRTAAAGVLAATSPNALEALSGSPEFIAKTNALTLFAVGHATAQAAVAAGYRNVIAGDGDGAALARTISAFAGSADRAGPVLYLAGRPRAGGFERQAGELGLTVNIVEFYEMEKISYSTDFLLELFSTPNSGILLYSRKGAERLVELFQTLQTRQMPVILELFCLSAAIAEALPVAMRGKVHIAGHPDEDSLLAMLPEPTV